MFKPNYKDWPKSYRNLLHYTIILTMVALAALWLGIYPRWRSLGDLQETIARQQSRLEKNGVELDADMLKDYIDECKIVLNGTETEDGLTKIADETLAKAAATFRNDIHNSYPSDEVNGLSPEDQFIYSSTRIDYKDLSDRIKSEFKEKKIIINEKSFESDTAEPVFHLMLKLWTIRILLRNAIANSLAIDAQENGEAMLSATRTIAYSIGNDNTKPYLLEFPVSIHLTGTMDNFLKFAKSLQQNGYYLPIKNLRVYSEPPKALPPGAKVDVSQLHFRVTCSAFFPSPSSTSPLNVAGGTKDN
ncbi:MAG: hypothetical protein K5787_19905 [Lentisphaeria bacterium]|nr:hypothetical protein [Lentisphaeria bacterium]